MVPLVIINPHNGIPAYRQIIDQVKLQVATGVLAAGTEMASTRTLSAELQLNPMTVSKAYALLEHEHVLERRRGQTLVVRAQRGTDAHADKLEHLRKHLAQSATLARQLGISDAVALKAFRESLDSTP